MKFNFKISPKETETIVKPVISPRMPQSFPVEIPYTPVKKPVSRRFYYLIFFALVVIATVAATGLEWWREKKYNDNVDKIWREHHLPVCEQYALKARKSGWYPCFNCNGKETIYLNAGEVWRYGMTGEGGKDARYPSKVYFNQNSIKMTDKLLLYETQFRGTKEQCLIEEQRKIFSYPLLPECQLRNFKLDRPPGNKQDR